MGDGSYRFEHAQGLAVLTGGAAVCSQLAALFFEPVLENAPIRTRLGAVGEHGNIVHNAEKPGLFVLVPQRADLLGLEQFDGAHFCYSTLTLML